MTPHKWASLFCLFLLIIPSKSTWTGDLSSAAASVFKWVFPPKAAAADPDSEDGGLAVEWGIQDTEALVGRVFSLPIPWRAFSTDGVSYYVSTGKSLGL